MIKNKIFPIGIGTWGIGGFVEKDLNNDQKSLDAVKYSLSKGMNFIEVNYWNAKGHSVELLAKAIKESKVPRDQLFLHQALYCYNNTTLKDVKNEMQAVRELLDTDYMDSIEFDLTGINKYGFENVIEFLKNALKLKEANFVSLTNSNLEILKRFKSIFGDKIFCHELNFNFEIRENEDLGIIDFAEKNQIKNVLYQPLRRNRTANRNWKLLVDLSKKYNRTQNQILINWLVGRKFLPLIKSSNISHIDENIDALNFKLKVEDIKRLNEFRPKDWKTPKIVWSNNEVNENNIIIHQLSNVFDDIYDKKLNI